MASLIGIEQHKQEICKLLEPKIIIETSSVTNTNITTIIQNISNYLSFGVEVKDEDHEDKFIISEIIREQIIKLTKQEIPYSVTVMIEQLKYEDKNNMFHIHANIVVEKQSQKPIIIGAQGKMIKQIGINARQELLKIYNCKINLQLFVKIKQD